MVGWLAQSPLSIQRCNTQAVPALTGPPLHCNGNCRPHCQSLPVTYSPTLPCLPGLALPVLWVPAAVQGAVINQIKELLGVSIRISKKGEFLPGSHDRACSITGTLEVRRWGWGGGGGARREGAAGLAGEKALLCPALLGPKVCLVCTPRCLLCPCIHAASSPWASPALPCPRRRLRLRSA